MNTFKNKTLAFKNNALYLLNQTLLPLQIKYVKCATYSDVAAGIKNMIVRGAPAIGVAAAYGMLLAVRQTKTLSAVKRKDFLKKAAAHLINARPTAVNLAWAVNKMAGIINACGTENFDKLLKTCEKECAFLFKNDINTNKLMGNFGAKLLKKNSVVLTHCNAGALATVDYGTALGVIRSAFKAGKIKMVYADETRPYLQGARLTAWELAQAKIPHRLITDNMAAYIMKTEKVNAIIVGADRIAANGDAANKIGTYGLSILAKYHKIPFYIAAPVSTIDFNISTGNEIIIEERSSDEVTIINGRRIAPLQTKARHPGFDVTPAQNITAIITERGAFKPNQIKKLK
jgi:methylthioribose-1-phosphate isomerase